MSATGAPESAGQATLTEVSPYAALAAAAARYPGNEFLLVPAPACAAYSDGPISLTYSQALAQVERLATNYREAGLGVGHRVALLLENRPEYFLHWFALNALGASVVPVNPDSRHAEIAYLLAHSEAILAICIPERAADLQAAAAEAGRNKRVAIPDEVAGGLARIAASAEPCSTSLEAECALMYSVVSTVFEKYDLSNALSASL